MAGFATSLLIFVMVQILGDDGGYSTAREPSMFGREAFSPTYCS